MAAYAIRGGDEGRRRLDLLAQIMAPTTSALLAEVGVRSGINCLDLGCGGGHVTRCLAELVGAGGRVTGLDLDAVKLAAAWDEGDRAGYRNLDFRVANVAEWAETDTYDLVYGRFILSHLADRQTVVRRMYAALRSGGVLVLEDIDFAGAFCHPPTPPSPDTASSTAPSSGAAAATPGSAPSSSRSVSTPGSRACRCAWSSRYIPASRPRRR
ncbi:MAG: class I SAM-dependent methyltransferase [Gemmatimonadales bacterium]